MISSCSVRKCKFSFQIRRSILTLLCNLSFLSGWSSLKTRSTSCFSKMGVGVSLSGSRYILHHDSRVSMSERSGFKSPISLCLLLIFFLWSEEATRGTHGHLILITLVVTDGNAEPGAVIIAINIYQRYESIWYANTQFSFCIPPGLQRGQCHY